MRKITFLFSFLAMCITMNAQVVQSFFNPDPASGLTDGIPNWADTGTTPFNQFLNTMQVGNANLRVPNNAVPPVMSYTGSFNGTVDSTGDIVLEWRHQGFMSGTEGAATQLNVTFDEDGLTRTVVVPIPALGPDFETTTVSGGFTDGATLSNLSLTITNAALESTFDNIRLQSFTINSTSSLSVATVNEIPGASITAEGGSITVEGANLDAVYALTGQQVNAFGLPNGIYIVRVSKGGQSSTLKVIMD